MEHWLPLKSTGSLLFNCGNTKALVVRAVTPLNDRNPARIQTGLLQFLFMAFCIGATFNVSVATIASNQWRGTRQDHLFRERNRDFNV